MRKQTRTKNMDFPSEYQIGNEVNIREKPLVSFNRVQPLKPQENQQTPIKLMEEVHLSPKAPISTSREPYSFLKNTTNTATIGSSNSINDQSNRVTKYPSSGYAPVNFQSATPAQQSNPNLNSQRTVSNAGTSRRV